MPLCLPPPFGGEKIVLIFCVQKIVLGYILNTENVHVKCTPRHPPFQICKYATDPSFQCHNHNIKKQH